MSTRGGVGPVATAHHRAATMPPRPCCSMPTSRSWAARSTSTSRTSRRARRVRTRRRRRLASRAARGAARVPRPAGDLPHQHHACPPRGPGPSQPDRRDWRPWSLGDRADQWWQPQALPHPPPVGRGADGAAAPLAPTLANADSNRIESTWPCGHSAGALASLIGRRRSKVSSQVRQRYSYNGMT